MLFPCQEEMYDHLDAADVDKVDKLASEAMIWMNSKMNQQSKQNLTLEPAVKVPEIQAKIKVAMMACWPDKPPVKKYFCNGTFWSPYIVAL